MKKKSINSTLSSECITDGIHVEAKSFFLEEKSDIVNNQYIYGYQISITNNKKIDVQLLSRYWLIINSDGERKEVEGEGVVGEKPIIKPNETYSYNSFCPLDTNFGTMEGYYIFKICDSDENRTIKIPRFYLATNSNSI